MMNRKYDLFFIFLITSLLVFFFVPIQTVENDVKLFDGYLELTDRMKTRTVPANSGDKIRIYFSADYPIEVYLFSENDFTNLRNNEINYIDYKNGTSGNLVFDIIESGKYYVALNNSDGREGRITYVNILRIRKIYSEKIALAVYFKKYQSATSLDLGLFTNLFRIVILGVQLSISVAMYRDARARGHNKELWFLIGLFLGIIGALIYLFYQQLDKE